MEQILTRSELESAYYSYLLLTRRVVGVKLYDDATSYNKINLPRRKGSASYCQMIKMASAGKVIKADNDNFSCDTSARVMGLRPYYDEEEGLQGWEDSGLYSSRKEATTLHETVQPVRQATSGIITGPLSKLPDSPDIIMIPCTPYQAMRIIQGYTYHYGFKKDIKMSGQCGVCFESTALPLREQDLSVSLLCSGTRYICKWPEDTMMVAFPYSMAAKILDGIVHTAQRCEPDTYKHRIMKRLYHHKFNFIEKLTDGKAYFYENK